MEPLRLMIGFYLLGEAITAWFCFVMGVAGIFLAFLRSHKKHENEPKYDRMFLMSGILITVGLALLLHFFGRGSDRAIALIQEAYKLPYLFK